MRRRVNLINMNLGYGYNPNRRTAKKTVARHRQIRKYALSATGKKFFFPAGEQAKQKYLKEKRAYRDRMKTKYYQWEANKFKEQNHSAISKFAGLFKKKKAMEKSIYD